MLSGHHDRRQEPGTTEENPGLGITAEGRGLGIMEEGRDLRSMEEEHGGRQGGLRSQQRAEGQGPWRKEGGLSSSKELGTMEENRDLGTWRRAGMEYHRGGQGLGIMEEDKGVGDHTIQQGLSAATQRCLDGGPLPPATGAHANCSL